MGGETQRTNIKGRIYGEDICTIILFFVCIVIASITLASCVNLTFVLFPSTVALSLLKFVILEQILSEVCMFMFVCTYVCVLELHMLMM